MSPFLYIGKGSASPKKSASPKTVDAPRPRDHSQPAPAPGHPIICISKCDYTALTYKYLLDILLSIKSYISFLLISLMYLLYKTIKMVFKNLSLGIIFIRFHEMF